MEDQRAEAVIWQKWPLVDADTKTTSPHYVGAVILHRPAEANAFHGGMMDQLRAIFANAAGDDACRLLVLLGAGRHFSAGADLDWMRSAVGMSLEQNRKESQKLLDMCEALYQLPMPTLALVHGAAYGGAVGLVACCDIALAEEGSRFCLSEVKMGLIPAVIAPYLAKKMLPVHLHSHALTARIFDATAAERCGLIQKVLPREGWDNQVRDEIDALLATAPLAQRSFKRLSRKLQNHNFAQGDYTVEAISVLRVAPEAQLALGAFLDKKESPWRQRLAPDQTLSLR